LQNLAVHDVISGTKVIWQGWTPAESDLGPSTATYWLDGGDPVTFELDPLDPASNSTVHDVTLIEVGGLSPNMVHNLTVMFNGPSTPLVLNRLLVQGGNFVIEPGAPTPFTPTTSSTSVPPLPSDSITSTKGPDRPSPEVPVGKIAGSVVGVVGGLVFLALIIIARRKYQKRKLDPSDSAHPTSATQSSPPASTPITAGYTSQSASNSEYLEVSPSTPSEVASPPGYQSKVEKPTKHRKETPAEPSSTLIPAPTTLQAQGITVNQGDFALAAGDVHIHKHYHWNSAPEVETQAANIHSVGGQASSSMLVPPPHHPLLLDMSHSNLQSDPSYRIVPAEDPIPPNSNTQRLDEEEALGRVNTDISPSP
jgi:hypothetical protein